METNQLHTLFLKTSGICTDTRKINNNCLFIALKGESFNGNNFAAEALDKGAAYAILDEPQEHSDERYIMVPDALKTLQTLASFHRSYLGIPIIGLTGSNGKTTTKELINVALSKKFRVTATQGNLNNHIGVPLTLLSMTERTEIGIVEMGANHPGEIAFLSNMVHPDYGYITNFGKAHLEGFGGIEGVIKAKSELYRQLKTHHKKMILNIDDPVQIKQLPYEEVLSFGQHPDATEHIQYLQHGSYAAIKVGDLEIQSQLTGHYNGRNLAAAYTIAHYFGVEPDEIRDALEHYVPANNRSQIIHRDQTEIILDAYNANPTSMVAAIDNLENLDKHPKIAILGDMFEMGKFASIEHEQLVDKVLTTTIDKIYLIGENFYHTPQENPVIRKFRSYEDFANGLDPNDLREAIVLIKGSRGMALERTLNLL